MPDPKSKNQKITLLAFVALIIGAVALILRMFLGDLFGSLVDFLMFSVAGIVSYNIVKDGKPFFSSFYKIAYTLSLIVVAIFIIIPFVKGIMDLIN